jgi:hypothetical protein
MLAELFLDTGGARGFGDVARCAEILQGRTRSVPFDLVAGSQLAQM